MAKKIKEEQPKQEPQIEVKQETKKLRKFGKFAKTGDK